MIKKVIVTTALMAFGVVAAFGGTAVAQRNRPTTDQNPTNQPTTDQNPTNQPTTDQRPTNRPTTQPRSGQVSSFDAQFMMQAAQGGMAEVQLSQVALKRGSNGQVKQFAQRMIKDHTEANRTLEQLAQKKRVTLPRDMDAQHKAIRSKLEQLSGESFDREYMRVMEMDHAKTVALFQSATQEAQDSDVRAFASNTLPNLQGHLEMARTMTGNNSAGSPNSHGNPNSSGR